LMNSLLVVSTVRGMQLELLSGRPEKFGPQGRFAFDV